VTGTFYDEADVERIVELHRASKVVLPRLEYAVDVLVEVLEGDAPAIFEEFAKGYSNLTSAGLPLSVTFRSGSA
jgi:hypothetical protein